jgi:O-antigen/teichoic acid export membrane protein
MATEVGNRLIAFVAYIGITRLLGDVNFGKFTLATNIGFMFTMIFADFGLNNIIIREVARDKTQTSKYVSNIAALRLFMSAITWIAIFVFVNVSGYPAETKNIVYLIGTGLILMTYTETFSSIFRAYEKMKYVSVLAFFQRTIPLVIGIILLMSGYGLVQLAICYLVFGFITVLLSIYLVTTRFVKFNLEFDMPFWKTVFMESFPLGITVIFSAVYFRIATIMLSLMKGDAAVGWYNASYRLIESLMFIPVSIIGALFPVLSQLSVESKDKLKNVSLKAGGVLLAIVLPIAIITTIFADKIILLLYGTQFIKSIPALQILIWAEVFIFVNYIMLQVLVATNQQKYNAMFAFCCMVFNIGMNLALIPKYSILGSSITTVGTELLLTIFCAVRLVKYFSRV